MTDKNHAYSSDKKKTPLKKVMIAVNGSTSSMVAAYFLQKQGYDVVAVGILFSYQDSSEDNSPIPRELIQLNIPDVDQVKALCDSIELTFYAVNAQEEYSYHVHEFLVSNTLACKVYQTEVFTTQLIVNILEEKAKKMGCEYIATGHFAKVALNKKSQEFSLIRSNDIENDQSYLLSRMKQPQLAKLLLPLSEMRKAEVEKIASVMGKTFLPEAKIKDPYKSGILKDYIAKNVARDLICEGEIMNLVTGDLLGEHHGLENFYPGCTELVAKSGPIMDKDLVVINYYVSKGLVHVCEKDELSYSHILVQSLNITPGFDVSRPIDTYIKINKCTELLAGKMYVKNNNIALIVMKQKQEGIVYPGEFLCFYNKPSSGARVIGSAIATYSYIIEKGRIFRFPLTKDEREELEEDEQKRKYEAGF